MQSNAWALLLRQFPPEQHDNLMLVTTSGTKITVQNLLCIDHEHVAVRGRLTGSQDAGRLFILPYQTIEYLGTQRACKEAEYHELFDKVKFPEAPSPAAAVAAAAPALPSPEPQAAPAPDAEEATATAVAPSTKTPVPIRSAVLERFRARTNPGSCPSLPRIDGTSSLNLPRPSDVPPREG
jgi:hypothetical protein